MCSVYCYIWDPPSTPEPQCTRKPVSFTPLFEFLHRAATVWKSHYAPIVSHTKYVYISNVVCCDGLLNKKNIQNFPNLLNMKWSKTIQLIYINIFIFFSALQCSRLSKCHKHCKQHLCKVFRAGTNLSYEHMVFCCKLYYLSYFWGLLCFQFQEKEAIIFSWCI